MIYRAQPRVRAEQSGRAGARGGWECGTAAPDLISARQRLGQSWQSSRTGLAALLGSLCDPLRSFNLLVLSGAVRVRAVQAPADLLYLSSRDAHEPVVLEKGSTASLCVSHSQFPGVLARAAQCKCTGGNDNS